MDRARKVFERYIEILPSVQAWVRYAKFEMKNGDISLARQCYERAVEALGEDGQTVSLGLIAGEDAGASEGGRTGEQSGARHRLKGVEGDAGQGASWAGKR